jgi:uncharacterized phage-associated protein
MASVHDVAAYILHKQGKMTAMKLQKLLYYSQAWSLAWDERRLFNARIEAWANGPVVPAIYRLHRQEFYVSRWPWGNRTALNKPERETVNAVLKVYGDKPSYWLSDVSHREKPWKDARKGLGPLDRGVREITVDAMAKYFGNLLP